MPAKSEKQRKFFGAVMGAKKGKGKVTGAAKKAAKEMPEKEIKKFLKKESYDDVVNAHLKKYLIEMDVRQDPREVEGIVDYPNIDEPDDREQEDREFNEWLKQKFKDRPGFLKNLAYDQDMVMDLFYDFKQERAQPQPQSREEDYEEECESAKEGCKCNNCPECQSNQQGDQMLSFYGFK